MDDVERERVRAAGSGYARHAEFMLTALERQRDMVADIGDRLARLRFEVVCADGTATVVVDATGLVLAVRLTSDAFDKGTPERLGMAIMAAVAEARATAREQTAAIVAPLGAAADIPDLPDLIPGAPSLRELRESAGEVSG